MLVRTSRKLESGHRDKGGLGMVRISSPTLIGIYTVLHDFEKKFQAAQSPYNCIYIIIIKCIFVVEIPACPLGIFVDGNFGISFQYLSG